MEIKFDPKSRVAFKIDAEEEEAKIEGIVVEVEGDQVTVETERGRRLTLLVGDRTRIELEDDFPGTTADLQVGAAGEAKFDPYTRTAFKIGVEEEEAEIEGVVVELAGNEVTVETKSGRRLTLVIGDRTRIELEDDFPGTYADLKVGEAVGAKFDPVTRMAFKLDVKGGGKAEVKGVIVGINGKEITIETESGLRRILTVTDQTRIQLEDNVSGKLADLRVGTEVEVKFDPAADLALNIDLKD